MAIRSSIDSYGGQFVDLLPVENPVAEQSAAYANRLHEDVAQMTRTACKAIVRFALTTAGAPITLNAANVDVWTQWGTSATYKPTIAKTATGTYTVTFGASYNDALSVPETVSLVDAFGHVSDLTNRGHVYATVSGAVVSVLVTDTSNAASDLSNSRVVLHVF